MLDLPEPDRRVERTIRRLGWVLAILAPLVVCVGLIAVREDIDRSTAALLLVLPVVLVAVIGGPGAAALAAVVAPVAFDILLTQPHYRLQMHAEEDVEASLILLAIGLVVGQLVSRETRSRARMTTRGTELDALVMMMTAAAASAGKAGQAGEAQLVERAVTALEQLLDLRGCRWASGYHGGAYPHLTHDGDLVGGEIGARDLAPLPASGVEVPVIAGIRELGRLILVPAGSAPVSREERIVAVAIADVLGLALARRETD